MTKVKLLNDTLDEVNRFKRNLEALISEHNNKGAMYKVESKTRSSAKRSSMDLTRQLAEFRRIKVF